ncbi:MAG TPA: hypothetical protein VLX44_20685 [Xanthobacteraceae bacterium]|nr:hypothetical protein [Xanthobacteraceae bacterium]
MPIAPHLDDPASFDPEVTRAMGVAFERACGALGLADVTDSMTQVVAIKIIEVAMTGERDAGRLYDAVMEWSAHAA